MSDMDQTENNEPEINHAYRSRYGCRGPGFFRRLFRRRGYLKGRNLQRGVKRLTAKLNLVGPQRDGLEDLFRELESLRQISIDGRMRTAENILAAMGAETFDMDKVRSGFDGAMHTLQSQLGVTIETFTTWFNNLNFEQRNKVRYMLQQRLGVPLHAGSASS